MFRTIDPATGKETKRYDAHSSDNVDRRLAAVHEAWRSWSQGQVTTRVPLLRELARLLEDQREDHANGIVKEMGKPVTQARAEVDKCARLCLYVAEHGPRMLSPQPDSSHPVLTRGETIARERLEAGVCFVNEIVKSDPRMPFGGVKKSGYGWELSHFGLWEFANIKTVSVHPEG